MKEQDELRDLWCSQPPWGDMKGEEIMAAVQKRIARFDRMIAVRNLAECIAAGLVVAFFGWLGLRTHDSLMQAGFFIVAAGAAWIIYYLARHGQVSVSPDPNQCLPNYIRALIERYDHQIYLLKNVKYWYLLPMFVGLLITSVALYREHPGAIPFWSALIMPAIYTAVFVGVWWLNEVVAVGRLRQERARLFSLSETMNSQGGQNETTN